MSRINVKTKQKHFDTAPDLYGIFFEDISHAGDGGLYPELLRNRRSRILFFRKAVQLLMLERLLFLQPDGLTSSTTERV